MTENYISKEEALYIVRCIKNKLYILLDNKTNSSAQDFITNYDEHNNNFTNAAYPGRLISAVKAYQDLVKSGMQPKESSGYFIDKYQMLFTDDDLSKHINSILELPNSFVSRAYNGQTFSYDNSTFSLGGTNNGENTSTCYLLLNIPYKMYNKYQALRALYFANKWLIEEGYTQQDLIRVQWKGIPPANKFPDFKNEILRMELSEFLYGLAISQNVQEYDFEVLEKYSDVFENICPMYFDTDFSGYRSLFTRSTFSGNDLHFSKFLFMYKKFKELVIEEDVSEIFNYLPDSILDDNSREKYFDKIKSLYDNFIDQVGEFYKLYVLNDNKVYFGKLGSIIVETGYIDVVHNIISSMLNNIDSYINRVDSVNSSVNIVREEINANRAELNTGNEEETYAQTPNEPNYREIVLNNISYYQKRINGRWVPCDENEARSALGLPEPVSEPVTIRPVADGTCMVVNGGENTGVRWTGNLEGAQLTENTNEERNHVTRIDAEYVDENAHIPAVNFEHTPIEVEEHEDGTMRATSTLHVPEEDIEEAREYLEHMAEENAERRRNIAERLFDELIQSINRDTEHAMPETEAHTAAMRETVGDALREIERTYNVGLLQNNGNIDNEIPNRTQQPTIHFDDFVYDHLNMSARMGDYQDVTGRTRIDENGGIHFVR